MFRKVGIKLPPLFLIPALRRHSDSKRISFLCLSRKYTCKGNSGFRCYLCHTKLELSCLALWTSAHPKSGCQETIFNVLGIHRFKMYTDAFERKLGPIYEAIDAQKYKNCTKLIEASLRKYPKSQLLKALKAFCQAKTNKKESAESLLNELVKEGPEDDRVLHTLTFVYKELGMKEHMLKAYVSASEKRPKDVGIRVGLFSCYVKYLDYVHQQQEAFKLLKLAPAGAEMYSWWSVCSLLMQSIEAVKKSQDFNDPTTKRLLQLAFSIVKQRRGKAKDEKLSFEKFLVLLDLLCGLGNMEEVLECIESFNDVCGDNIPETEKDTLSGCFNVRAGQLSKAASFFFKVSLENPQDWLSWHLFVVCTIPEAYLRQVEIRKEKFSLSLRKLDGGLAELWDELHLHLVWSAAAKEIQEQHTLEKRLANLENCFDKLKEKYGSLKKHARCLALARLELCQKKHLCLQTRDSEEDLLHAILDSIPRLVQYSSFCSDLRLSFSSLGESSRQILSEKGHAACVSVSSDLDDISNGNGGADAKRKSYTCLVNAHLLQYELGTMAMAENADYAIAHSHQLLRTYFDHSSLFADFDPKDKGLGEELFVAAMLSLTNAAQIMMKAQKIEGGSTFQPWYLLVAGVLGVEAAQIKRQVSAPLRLTASAIYGLLGAPSLSSKQFSRLDIKGILHDSLSGHWIVPILLGIDSSEDSFAKWFQGFSNLYTVQEMEAREALVTAFEQGTFSKVPEFVDFIHSLNASATRALYESEQALLQFRMACAEMKAGDQLRNPVSIFERSKKIHNDDLTVRPLWYPPCPLGPQLQTLWWWHGFDVQSVRGGWSRAWWAQQSSHSRTIYEGIRWEEYQDSCAFNRALLPSLVSGLVSSDVALEMNTEVFQRWLRQQSIHLAKDIDFGSLNIRESEDRLRLIDALSSSISPNDEGRFLDSFAIPNVFCTALFATAYDLQVAATTTFPTEAATTMIGKLQDIMTFASQVISALLSTAKLNSSQDYLPFPGNGGLSLVCRLVKEEYLWTVLFIKHWMKYSRKGGPWEILNNIREPVQQLASTLCTDLQNILSILTEMISGDASLLASKIIRDIEIHVPTLCEWKNETEFYPEACVQELLHDQMSNIKTMQKEIQKLIKPLESYQLQSCN